MVLKLLEILYGVEIARNFIYFKCLTGVSTNWNCYSTDLIMPKIIIRYCVFLVDRLLHYSRKLFLLAITRDNQYNDKIIYYDLYPHPRNFKFGSVSTSSFRGIVI